MLPLCLPATWQPHQILYSFRSRCGNRLKNGDFDRSSDALVLAVRDRSSTGGAAKDGDTGCGGDSAGELVAVVELTIRQPDGSLPFNWPFPVPWKRQVSANGNVRAGENFWLLMIFRLEPATRIGVRVLVHSAHQRGRFEFDRWAQGAGLLVCLWYIICPLFMTS